MEWTQIIITLITALFGSAGIVTLYIKSRLDKAQKKNAEIKKIDATIQVQEAAKERCLESVIDLLCRKMNGEQINGELKEANKELSQQFEELQKLLDERAAILRQG